MTCEAVNSTGRFDPRLCPLLAHLPPDEQAVRMRSDPMIAACIRAVDRRANVSTPPRVRASRRSLAPEPGVDA